MKKIFLLFLNLFLVYYCFAQNSLILYSGTDKVSFYSIDEDYVSNFLDLDSLKDTFCIKISKPVMYNNSNSNIPFILFPMDTLLIVAEKKNLNIQALHNAQRDNEIKCTELLYSRYGPFVYEDFDDPDRLPFVSKVNDDNFNANDKEYFKQFGTHLKKPASSNFERDSIIYHIYKKRISLIDSFKVNNEISIAYYDFMNSWLLYRYLYLSIKGFEFSKEKFSDNLQNILSSKKIINDSFVTNINTYRAFIYFYNDYLTTMHLKRKGTDLEKLKNAKMDFSGQTRDRILTTIIYQKIIEKKVDEDALDYYFKNCSNYKYISRIKSRLQLYKSNVTEKDEVLLMNDEKKNFGNIISSDTSNIILLDFWASWCAPCMAEMNNYPAILNLYKSKKIKFIFISMDTDEDQWKITTNEFKDIMNDENSFLLVGNFNALISKKYKIETIPRYILLGKDGKAISIDAPRPSDPELKKIIDKLLAE